MYYSIHSMKNEGFSKRQIAKRLELDFRTVSKYLSLTPEEFEGKVLTRERRRNLTLYEGVVTDWLRQYPDMSAAQIHDWLKEHYQVAVAERTARRFVEGLRKQHGIPKTKEPGRQYEAVEDPPMGQQMQVDIGEVWVYDAYKQNRIKLYCLAAVLSHSRYKCGVWYAAPLTAAILVQALELCFEYLGGMPKQLVFDQDRLMTVDENYGDIIFTKEFDAYRQSCGFEVRLCRASDPESKGRIEAVVKFFKRNFAKNRQFAGIDFWNESFEDWLYRTGNAKQHETTKKIPAEVFMQERLLLKPVPSTRMSITNIITRTVHKNNTIFYEGNRYSVPLGTYSPGLEVSLDIEGDKLIISNIFGDYIITEHTLSKGKGELVSNNNHKRDVSEKLDIIQGALWSRLNNSEEAGIFLTQIRKLKSRYTRDQFSLINKTLDGHSSMAAWKSLNYCITHSLFSAVEFKNAAEYFEDRMEDEAVQLPECKNIIIFNASAAVSKKRELSEYAQAVRGGDS